MESVRNVHSDEDDVAQLNFCDGCELPKRRIVALFYLMIEVSCDQTSHRNEYAYIATLSILQQ